VSTYTLSEAEKECLAGLQRDHNESKAVLENAEQVIAERRSHMVAIQGAIQGCVLLIAKQQGLDGKAELSADFTTITIS
jgi:hypothetical protein